MQTSRPALITVINRLFWLDYARVVAAMAARAEAKREAAMTRESRCREITAYIQRVGRA